MRAYHITCQFRPYKSGISEAAYFYACELQKHGHDITIITAQYDASEKKDEVIDRIHIRRVKPLFSFGNAAFMPRLYNELRGSELIHVHYPFFGAAVIAALYAFFNKKVKVIMTYHMDTGGDFLRRSIFYLHRFLLLPFILSQVDQMIVTSTDYACHSFIRKWVSKNKDKVSEIGLGVDPLYEKSETAIDIHNNFDIKKGTPYYLFVGAMDTAHDFKGVDILLKAFSSVQGGQLILVGDGDKRKGYEQLARELGIERNVLFVGRVTDEELVALYTHCYATVLPSINRAEAFGIVLAQAMACSKPVIASDLPGVRTVVKDKSNGLLVKPAEVESLLLAIQYLLDNPLIAKEMGEQGRVMQRTTYSWNTIGQKLSLVYETLKTS